MGLQQSTPAVATPQRSIVLEPHVQSSAFFQAKATGATGMQWNPTWRLHRDPQTGFANFTFLASQFKHGLLIGLSNGMSDTAGGVVLHIGGKNYSNNQYSNGMSSMHNVNQMTVYNHRPVFDIGQSVHFWVQVQPYKILVGLGTRIGDQLLLDCKVPDTRVLEFFGFGTNTGDDYIRVIDNVAVVRSIQTISS